MVCISNIVHTILFIFICNKLTHQINRSLLLQSTYSMLNVFTYSWLSERGTILTQNILRLLSVVSQL